MFDQYSTIGGGQTVLLDIAEVANKVADNVIIAIPNGGALANVIRQRVGPDVVVVSTPSIELTHGRKRVRDILRLGFRTVEFVVRHWTHAKEACLLYANGPRQFMGVAIVSAVTKCPAIYHVHLDHGMLEKRIVAFVAGRKYTARLILNSPFTRDKLVAVAPALAESRKVLVIDNALGERFDKRGFVDRFYSNRATWSIFVLGVIRPEKGQDIAVELAQKLPNVMLYIVGSVGTGAEEWAERLIERAPENVKFVGFVEDVATFVEEHDVQFCLVPSRAQESFGLAAVEAMACSCITVVRNTGALADISTRTGAVGFSDGVQELVGIFESLMKKNPEQLRELAEEQHRRTLLQYCHKRFADELEKVLRTEIFGELREESG